MMKLRISGASKLYAFKINDDGTIGEGRLIGEQTAEQRERQYFEEDLKELLDKCDIELPIGNSRQDPDSQS